MTKLEELKAAWAAAEDAVAVADTDAFAAFAAYCEELEKSLPHVTIGENNAP